MSPPEDQELSTVYATCGLYSSAPEYVKGASMSDAPWTITSSKRKSNKRAASPRKRTKRAHCAITTNEDGTASKPQQTLTQIAFVTHSSVEDEDPLIDFEPLPTGSPQPGADELPRVLKRDSTLTQMDFGSSFGSTGKRRSSTMHPPIRKARKKLKKRDSTLTQMEFFNANMDGASGLEETMLSSPVFTTPGRQSVADQSPSLDRASAVPLLDTEVGPIPSPDTQDYRPVKRKRRNEHEESELGKRRRSSRIAAATPAPTTTSVFVEPETIQPASATRRTPATASRRPLLEIRDSTDFLEESVQDTVLPQPGMAITPSTPTRNLQRIPSSQTPESIRRDTSRYVRSPSKGTPRQALAELSSNLRMPGQKVAQHKSRVIDVLGIRVPKKSPPRKVCTLKLPSMMLASMEQTHQDEVLDHDIYSIQATSSPSKRGSSPQKTTPRTSRTVKRVDSSSGGPTIKETASSQRRLETQESLPDICDVLNIPRIADIEGIDEDQVADPATPTKTRRIPPVEKHSKENSVEKMLLDQEPENMIPELEEVNADELSDLGSPVANDTQFVRSLHERLSSPVAPAISNLGAERAVTIPRMSIHSPVRARGLQRTNLPVSSPKRSPLPAPKLVKTSPIPKPVRQATTSSSLRALPSFSTQNRSFENVQVSLVPLNDTVEYQQSSSSPYLPPAPTSSTRGSTRLASIPHPSQVSTQAPSQAFFPSSSAPQAFPFPQDSEVERITVKDSSSYPARLSQMVQHVDDDDDDSESEGDLNLLDDLQNEDDLDLDPSTAPATFPKSKRESTQHDTLKEADLTQTPTQKSRRRRTPAGGHSSTQSSPIITNATTRSQRNAKLEVVNLTSSSSPSRPQRTKANDTTPRPPKFTPSRDTSPKGKHKADEPPSSSLSSSMYSPSPPRDLKRKYTPIPGFNNDTQSDFTQNGSVTAAYVHRMWDRGDLPRSFVPKPYKVKNFRPSLRGNSAAGGSKKGK